MSVYMENNCLSAPALAISAGTTTVAKISNTIYVKSLGRRISVSSGNLPSLTLASLPGVYATATMGSTPIISNNYLVVGGASAALIAATLADKSTQVFTACADIAEGTTTVNKYWLASNPFLTTDHTVGESDVPHAFLPSTVELGYLIIQNATGSAFTYGTTALDAASVTTIYTDNFGQQGK